MLLIDSLRSAYKDANVDEQVKKATMEFFEPKLKEAVAAGKDRLSIRFNDKVIPPLLVDNWRKMVETLKGEGLSYSFDGDILVLWGWCQPKAEDDVMWNDLVADFIFGRPHRRNWFNL